MVRWWAVLCVALCLPLAGCAANDTPPPAAVPGSVEHVEVTDTTGAIRGVVTDLAIKPIAGVKVSIAGQAVSVETVDDGGFVFTGLEPGDYFLTAEKPGFQATQTSTSVEAGDAEPAVLRIALQALAETLAYANLQVWEGFIQCAVSAVIVAGQVCGPLDDRFIFYFTVDRLPDFMQAEMVWKSSQAVTPMLHLGYYLGGVTDWKGEQGVSPLLVTATSDELAEARGDDTTDNPMRVFPPFLESGNPAQTAVTIVVNQAFSVYLTQFYSFTPRDDWLFIVDGPCEKPADCGGIRGEGA